MQVTIMNLQKAHERVDRIALWKAMPIYGLGGKLSESVKSFLSKEYGMLECLKTGRGEGAWGGESVIVS